uniref:Uncharacterized protein n=1 Tax=Rhizophora mucronata TaxID=61149 RepID=A0A2P2P925_RHIMU
MNSESIACLFSFNFLYHLSGINNQILVDQCHAIQL